MSHIMTFEYGQTGTPLPYVIFLFKCYLLLDEKNVSNRKMLLNKRILSKF